MSSISRLGSSIAKTTLLRHRTMASATAASEPVQRVFLERIREFKATNKGLDEAHEKALNEELKRLKRVFRIEDENKLTQLDTKFAPEHPISLHDIDDTMELRKKAASGELYTQLQAQTKEQSPILASIQEQTHDEYHLPPTNRPAADSIVESETGFLPPQIGEELPDYMSKLEKMTPEKLEEELRVKFGPNMPTIHDDKSPERDLVNFPRHVMPENSPPTRWHLVPESWFQFFYPVTGLTGLHILMFNSSVFLLSKEIVVCEHEFLSMLSAIIIFSTAVIWKGPKVRELMEAQLDKHISGWERWQKGSIAFFDKMQDYYKSQLGSSKIIDELYDIRKQDIEVQLEVEHRSRLKKIHDDTKRRLDYLVAIANSKRQVAHQHLVNWVISSARSSLGAKQDTEVLDNCVANLKKLAKTHANAI